MKVVFWIVFIISLILSFFAIFDLITGPSAVGMDCFFILITLSLLIGYLFRKTLLKILLTPFQVFKRDMNRKQRLVLAIFAPIIILFIALMIANSVSYNPPARTTKKSRAGSVSSRGIYRAHEPFNLDETWYVWFSALAFCSIFEYKLFEDKKKKDKELTGI